VDIIKTPNEYIDKKYVNMNGICKNSATLLKDQTYELKKEKRCKLKA
jgi:hypothetical protein